MNIQYRRDLWNLLTGLLTGNVAEIGVAEGNFSEEILGWPIKFPKLYLVDRWQCVPSQKGDASNPQSWHDNNLARVQMRLAKYEDHIVFLRGESTEMARKVPDSSLVLVYIDADHSFDGVMNDIIAWKPKLVPGAYMAFHDYENPNYGVKRAVNVFCRNYGLQVRSIPEDKPEDAGAYFRWEGAIPRC